MSGQTRVFQSLSLLALFLALSPFVPCRDPSAHNISAHSPENATPPEASAAKNYVVRFLEYRRAEDHRSYIEEKIGSLSGWRWVERRNPAASFPTDFGLLAIEELYHTVVIMELERLQLVKDVIVDSSYTRTLFGDSSEKYVAFSESTKRSGKLFTSMSYEGEQIYTTFSNSTISWRKLMMDVCPSSCFRVIDNSL